MALSINVWARRDEPQDDHHDDRGGLSGWAIFIIVVVVFILLAGAGWFLWAQLRKRNLTPNYPAPRPGGIMGWVNDKFQNIKNRRTAAGAYEGTSGTAYNSGGGGASRGRRGAPLDPDEAWDSRVGNEADVYGPGGYYEEQELGLHPPTAYSGTGYGQPGPGFGPSGTEDRKSRSRQRDLDERHDGATDARLKATNPFGDEAELSSMRGVSPRPLDTSGASNNPAGSPGFSPTSPSERKSMFKEVV